MTHRVASYVIDSEIVACPGYVSKLCVQAVCPGYVFGLCVRVVCSGHLPGLSDVEPIGCRSR